MEYKRSYHPKWETLKNNNTKKIIIGTMPPARLCYYEKECINRIEVTGKKINDYEKNIDYFYCSIDNYFWAILLYLCNNNINENIKEKIEKIKKKINNKNELQNLLKSKNIAITDIIKSCIHNNYSSADSDLLSIEFISKEELKELLNDDIKIFCTSKFVKDLLCMNYASHYDEEKSIITIDEKNIKYIFCMLQQKECLIEQV